jgi:geranylgeranyl transferase type-2 subunit beta
MTLPAYLARLQEQLSSGVARLPESFCARQEAYLVACQVQNGGFPGRRGQADLYYTRFALQALALLGLEAKSPVWRRSAGYLRGLRQPPASVIDCLAFLHVAYLLDTRGYLPAPARIKSRTVDEILAILACCRTSDGGFAVSPEVAASSRQGETYHTFLAALCYNLVGKSLPDQDRAVELVLAHRSLDGGFAEVSGRAAGQTNPTAAAIALLQLADRLGAAVSQETAAWLQSMQSPDGGLRAHAAAESDLLSTFTGLQTLDSLGELRRVRLGAAARFVRALAAESGGFRATAHDAAPDVEYTFYGLGVLGLLAQAAEQGSAGTRGANTHE